MFLDETLVNFLKKKHKSEDPKIQVSVLETFESILPDIYNVYMEKLDLRDGAGFDEFENVRSIGGINTKDGIFYNKFFLPSCVFYIYQMWLEEYGGDTDDIFNECFTIGTGSATRDLFPEVTGLCTVCVGELFPNLQSKTASDIRQININIYKKQKDHHFFVPNFYSSTNSTPQHQKTVQPQLEKSVKLTGRNIRALKVEHAKIRVLIHELNDALEEASKKELVDVCVELEGKVAKYMKENKILESEIGLAEIGEPDTGVRKSTSVNDELLTDDETNENCCNPFESDDEPSSKNESPILVTNPFEDSDSENEPFLDACDICWDSFPSAEFLELHKRIFHSVKSLKTTFVASPVDLMTSFVKETEVVVNASGSSKNMNKLKKRLKFGD